MKDKMTQVYLARAQEIIGNRTPGEIVHDDAVVDALNQGHPIEAALAIAAAKHPIEALQWDASSINDIASHYDYLKEHAAIMQMIQSKKKK